VLGEDANRDGPYINPGSTLLFIYKTKRPKIRGKPQRMARLCTERQLLLSGKAILARNPLLAFFVTQTRKVRQGSEMATPSSSLKLIPVGFRITSSFWVTFFFSSSDMKSSKTKLQPNASASVLYFFSLTNSLAETQHAQASG